MGGEVREKSGTAQREEAAGACARRRRGGRLSSRAVALPAAYVALVNTATPDAHCPAPSPRRRLHPCQRHLSERTRPTRQPVSKHARRALMPPSAPVSSSPLSHAATKPSPPTPTPTPTPCRCPHPRELHVKPQAAGQAAHHNPSRTPPPRAARHTPSAARTSWPPPSTASPRRSRAVCDPAPPPTRCSEPGAM